MIKLRLNTVQINGIEYILPEGATDKEVAALCSALLSMRRIDSVYSSDYKTEFKFREEEFLTVRLGTREVYPVEEWARKARDARNAEIEAAKAAAETAN